MDKVRGVQGDALSHVASKPQKQLLFCVVYAFCRRMRGGKSVFFEIVESLSSL